MTIKILKPLALVVISFLQTLCFSQKKDVLTTFVNANFEEVESASLATAKEERWQENNVWKAKVFDLHSEALLAEYSYADSTRKLKHGVATYFGGNRKRIGQETYDMGI